MHFFINECHLFLVRNITFTSAIFFSAYEITYFLQVEALKNRSYKKLIRNFSIYYNVIIFKLLKLGTFIKCRPYFSIMGHLGPLLPISTSSIPPVCHTWLGPHANPVSTPLGFFLLNLTTAILIWWRAFTVRVIRQNWQYCCRLSRRDRPTPVLCLLQIVLLFLFNTIVL